MVDFTRLLAEESSAPIVNPAEIFQSLPRTGTGFGYLRNVQGDVLDAWHARRAERDVIVKMNTGSGKTLVGLLMLQSVLNEAGGTALYLCPTKQLVQQVYKQAADVGIPAVQAADGGELPHDFLNGEAILVTTFQKLFNGRSVFGIPGSSRQPVPVGAVLVDDAHSCLSIARDQVTVTLTGGSPSYERLLTLFRPALAAQCESKVAEIDNSHPWTVMPVPYWAWQDSQKEVASVLAGMRDEEPQRFAWDLIKDDLRACHCFISGKKLQITPHIVPIDSVPSFANAGRRFFLSATLVDDSVLLMEFGVSRQAASSTIRPQLVGDIGERMILAPSLIDKSLDAQVPAICKRIADAGYNVVVLVPSFEAGRRWVAAGASGAKADEVGDAVQRLRASTGNFVALANRYDGIDLPDDACRVLVLDGVPSGESYYEQHVSTVRLDSALISGRLAQTIEQGLGRGVRSGSDHCVALLCGANLVRFVGVKDKLGLFSPETRQQFLLGQEISKLAKQDSGSPAQKLWGLMQKCLDRDPGWKAYHARKMTGLKQPAQDGSKLDGAAAERRAALRFRAGGATEAAEIIQRDLDPRHLTADCDKGWFVQVAANYLHAADPVRAQEMQRKANEWNRYLLRPVAGIRYQKMIAKAGLQAENVLAWVRSHTDPNAVAVSMEAIINSLVFGVDHSRFEAAWAELGTILGSATQRPEEEIGQGFPDSLWNMPDACYLLAEIKNEVELERAGIHKSEAEQLSNGANWFRQEYGGARVLPVLIHPTEVLDDSAYPPADAVVMTPKKLEELHGRLRAFASALSAKPPEVWTAGEVGALLASHRLDAPSFRSSFFVATRRKA